MARIIAFANQKGGVGKTTSVLNAGAFLAAYGKHVLVVDLDPQSNATSGLGVDPRKQEWHLYHVLMDGVLPEEAIAKTGVFGLDVLPAHHDLAGANIELVSYPRREFRLAEALSRIRTNYDYILLDPPPSLGLLTLNGLVATENVIIPVQCEYYSLEGLGNLLGTIGIVEKNIGSVTNIMGVLLTMYDRRSRLNRSVVKEIRRNFPGRVFDSIIPRTVALAEAPSYGKTILEYDPNSKGSKAYRQLAEEILSLENEHDTLS